MADMAMEKPFGNRDSQGAAPGEGGQKAARQVSSRELAISLEKLYSRGVLLGLATLLLPAAIPVYDYLEVYNEDDRLMPYTFVFIGGNLLVGLVGLLASFQRKSYLLAVHIAMALIVGCVVGGLSLLLSHLMVLQCNLKAKTFEGCNELTCSCLLDDSCQTSDYDKNLGCAACKAYPNDVCSYFDYDSVTKGFNHETYKVLVIVLVNVFSAAHSLLILIRKEHFESIQSSRKELIVEHLKAQELTYAVPHDEGPQNEHQHMMMTKKTKKKAKNSNTSGKKNKVAVDPNPQANGAPVVGQLNQQQAQVTSPSPQAKGAAAVPAALGKPKKTKTKKKKKTKSITPVTSFDTAATNGGNINDSNNSMPQFDLGSAKNTTEQNTKMIDQSEYEKLRNSVKDFKQRDGDNSVENDLGIEDVDNFLGSLM